MSHDQYDNYIQACEDGETDWIDRLNDNQRYELLQEIWTNLTGDDYPGKKDIKEVMMEYIESDAESAIAEQAQCRADAEVEARVDDALIKGIEKMWRDWWIKNRRSGA